MHIETLRDYVLALPYTDEGFPFDEDTLVFKVMGKMFLLCSLEHQPPRFNFKALTDDCLLYREQYDSVKPGYHCDKRYWNTVSLDGSVPDDTLKNWIKDSYDLVVQKLPKYKQAKIHQA